MTSQIGITMGDPSGVGPEIIVATLAQMSHAEKASTIVVGNINILRRANEVLGLNLRFDCSGAFRSDHINVDHVSSSEEDMVQDGQISKAGGEAAYRYIVRAVDLAIENKIKVIVTAPINKEALHLAGHKFDGHTELLAHLTGAKESFMLLSGGKLSVIHVTTHMSLLNAVVKPSKKRIVSTIKVAAEHFRQLGIKHPRIAVAGLNPHCGEGGIFGNEEIEKVSPAISEAAQSGLNVVGPISGDTVFYRALKGEFDVVVAHYHDQGHIPTKLVSFEETVNVSLGLPILRTSVDHGTAFDIAWQGKAKNKNLKAAIQYARKIDKGD